MTTQGPSSGEARQQLSDLLESDFTPPEMEARVTDPSAGVLGRFLANTRPVEEIDARFGSQENQQLGHRVDRLLEPAPVTNAFKMFITNAVRRAHAWQDAVDEAVTPDRLELRTGEGIFDPTRSQDIEAQALRGFLFDVVQRHVVLAYDDAEEQPEPGVLNRAALDDDLFTLTVWHTDFEETYERSAFEGMEEAAFVDAAERALAVSLEEQEVNIPGTPQFSEELGRLRGDQRN